MKTLGRWSALFVGALFLLICLLFLVRDAQAGRFLFLVFFALAFSLGVFVLRTSSDRSGIPLRVLSVWSLSMALSLFFGGMAFYYDVPMRPGPDGTSVSKSGRATYTRAQYEGFNRWETALMLSVGAALLIVVNVEGLLKPENRRPPR